MTPVTSISDLRDRLSGLLADWGAELAFVLKELEERRARVAELENGAAGRDAERDALKERLEGQNALIDALRGDAEEASKLRVEIRSKDLEFERVNSELESKKELVRALRRDADGVDKAKTDAKHKDRELDELRTKHQRVERQLADAASELAALRGAAAARASENSEIDELRAELEARKTVIKSLRADQERVASLQASLDEKRDIIEQLEATIGRHSSTVAELRRSAEAWKRKYFAERGDNPTATTSINLPSLGDTDVRVIEALDKLPAARQADATIAIDMRRSLLEARRVVSKVNGEK